MSTRFNCVTGAAASRKRKRRISGASGSVACSSSKRSRPASKKKANELVGRMNGKLCRSLFCTGVNSASTPGGVEEVARLLDQAKKITRDSVFVDFGCSVGSVCVFVAARFGCKVIGIEKDVDAVQLGKKSLASYPALQRLCHFIVDDFVNVVNLNFLTRNSVAHVFAYDAVFSPDSWHMLFNVLAQGPRVVGVSCARKRDCKLPEKFETICKSKKPIGLCGSPSKFKVVSWRNWRKF